jgi:hypothetical protein
MGSSSKCHRPVLSSVSGVPAPMGNVRPPREVLRLLKGGVLATDAFLCELRRVSGFARPSKLCLSRLAAWAWHRGAGLIASA